MVFFMKPNQSLTRIIRLLCILKVSLQKDIEPGAIGIMLMILLLAISSRFLELVSKAKSKFAKKLFVKISWVLREKEHRESVGTPRLTHRAITLAQLQDNIEISKQLSLVGEQIQFKHFPEDESKRKLRFSLSKLFTVPEKLKPWYTYRNLWEEIRDDMRSQQVTKNY